MKSRDIVEQHVKKLYDDYYDYDDYSDYNDYNDDDDYNGEVDDGWLSVGVIGHRPSPPQCFAASNLSLSVAIPTFSCPNPFSLPFPPFPNSMHFVASIFSEI